MGGLSGIVQSELGRSPFGKTLFVFTNKRRKLIKLFYWDKNGFAIWYKKLEKDLFAWPKDGENPMSYVLGVNDFSKVEGGRWKAGGPGSECLVAGGEFCPTRNEQPVTRHGRVVLLVGWMLFGSWVGGAAAQETGWKADLARMGFEVPIEELERVS